MSGQLLLIDKPAGLTSFGVVARVRRVLSQQAGHKVKVGHTGTLDPFATGLLLLVTGSACKQAMHYAKLDKVYQATIRLGMISSTGDPEGELTVIDSAQPPSTQQVLEALRRHTGQQQQQPPVFSAIKINGQPAYKWARRGETVELPRRSVTIYSLELQQYQYPWLTIQAHVSSGTYIRSLAVDLGQDLQTGAYCHQLRRTRVADYRVEDAQSLADLGITS